MRTLSVTRFSLASGTTGAVLYLFCMTVTMTAPRAFVIDFFNSVLHGPGVTSIMRWETPWWEMVVGVLEVFVIGWLCEVILATVYNAGLRPRGDGVA
jgi:hypothetical protein